MHITTVLARPTPNDRPTERTPVLRVVRHMRCVEARLHLACFRAWLGQFYDNGQGLFLRNTRIRLVNAFNLD